MVASIRRQSSAGSLSVMRRHPVNATRRGAPSCRSRRVLATGAVRGMWASRLRPVERAAASIAAAGAMRSCVHPSCEVSIPGTRSPVQVSIPGGHVAPVRQRLRPMSPALGRDQWQPTGDCRDHRGALHRSRILVRKVIKERSVSPYPRHIQTPPTAPRGWRGPPLVLAGRSFHPFDVRAARAAFR